MKDFRELLLVMLVLGGLLTAGGSYLNYMSSKEKEAVCAKNLKEVAAMGLMYQEEHDGQFQPMIVRKATWEYWTQYLKGYCKDFIHFSCPADARRGAGAYETDELLPRFYSPGFVSYGMNYFLSDSGEKHMKKWPCNIKAMKNPAYIVYFGDSRTNQLRATSSCWYTDFNPVHDNQSINLAMLDGHVENFNKSNLGLANAFDGWKQDVPRWIGWK